MLPKTNNIITPQKTNTVSQTGQLSDNTTQSSTNTKPRAKTTTTHSHHPAPSSKKTVQWVSKNQSTKPTSSSPKKKNTFPTPQEIGASEIKEVSKDTFKVKGSGPLDIELTYWKHALEQMKKRGFTHEDVCQALSGPSFLTYKDRIVYTEDNGVRVVMAPDFTVITVISNNEGIFGSLPKARLIERLNGDNECKSIEELIAFYYKVTKSKNTHRRAKAYFNLAMLTPFSENLKSLKDHPIFTCLKEATILGHPSAPHLYRDILGVRLLKGSQNMSDEEFKKCIEELDQCVTKVASFTHKHNDLISFTLLPTPEQINLIANRKFNPSSYPLDGTTLCAQFVCDLLNLKTDLQSHTFLNELAKLAGMGHIFALLTLKVMIDQNSLPNTELGKSLTQTSKLILERIFKKDRISIDHDLANALFHIEDFLKNFQHLYSKEKHKQLANLHSSMLQLAACYGHALMAKTQAQNCKKNDNIPEAIFWSKRYLALSIKDKKTNATSNANQELARLYFDKNNQYPLALYHAYNAFLHDPEYTTPAMLQQFYEALFPSSKVLPSMLFSKILLGDPNNPKIAAQQQKILASLTEKTKHKDPQIRHEASLTLGTLSLLGISTHDKKPNPIKAVEYFKEAQKATRNIFDKSRAAYYIGLTYLNFFEGETYSQNEKLAYRRLGKSALQETLKLGRTIQNRRRTRSITFSHAHDHATKALKQLSELEIIEKKYAPFLK